MRSLLILVAVALLGAGTAAAGPRVALGGKGSSLNARGERIAQAPTKVDLAIAAVERAQRAHQAAVAERAAATRRYDAELAAIDDLKRQKASWRRDRALRGKLASSLETAQLLSTLATKVRRADAEVARAKLAAVAVIDAALPGMPADRKVALQRRRNAWAAPAPAAKKIVLPDGALDWLADPEELDDQAAALKEAEAALAAEVTRLDQRTARFDEMAELRRQHERAESMATEDDEVRRVAVRSGSSEVAGAQNGASAPSEDGATFDGPDNRDVATVLSDVVDARTVDVLRLSDRSSDPATWAAASRQAKDAVADRLAKLRKQRAAIEARARELRKP